MKRDHLSSEGEKYFKTSEGNAKIPKLVGLRAGSQEEAAVEVKGRRMGPHWQKESLS